MCAAVCVQVFVSESVECVGQWLVQWIDQPAGTVRAAMPAPVNHVRCCVRVQGFVSQSIDCAGQRLVQWLDQPASTVRAAMQSINLVNHVRCCVCVYAGICIKIS